MKKWFKELLIPSGEKTTVIAYNSWIVRWNSYHATYVEMSASPKKEAEIFPSEADANAFASQLKAAMELLKCNKTVISSIIVECNQSKIASFAGQ